jgi:hypothetical protein
MMAIRRKPKPIDPKGFRWPEQLRREMTMKAQSLYDLVVRLGMVILLTLSAFTAVSAQGAPPPCVPDPVNEDAVMEWNCRAFKYGLSSTFSGALRQIRAMALVQLAVHNAVNGITGQYETYNRDKTNSPPINPDQDAAAIGSAYQALYGIVTPAQRLQLDGELAASLAARGIPSDDPSLLYGKNEGQNIVNLRTGDGSGPEAQCAWNYPVFSRRSPLQPYGVAGDWIRILNVDTGVTPPPATPCWSSVPTFVLRAADQFPLDDPPLLTDDRYTQDFLEVKSIGGQNADTQREAWQSRIADFWDGPPIGIANQAIRQAANAQDMNLSSEARALAMVYLAGVDASIVCWYYKYEKLFWRPETAVNNAATDGNPDTDPLPGGQYWRPYLFPSHPHPEYPSGHSTNSGGMFSAAALVFGDEPGVTMTPTIIRNGIVVTPQWESFTEAINEVVDARVYSGLHYRFTDEASANLGRRVAHFVYTHALRECNRGKKCR